MRGSERRGSERGKGGEAEPACAHETTTETNMERAAKEKGEARRREKRNNVKVGEREKALASLSARFTYV